MPSTYTTNLGIEKIESGAQTGVWGTTTNTNLDIIDQAVNGVHVETLAVPGNSSSPNTLPISDGATSAGRNKFIEFADGGDLGATAYVQLTPNDAEKIVFMRNSLSGGRSVIVFQGTYNAANDFEIPNGADVILKFDGGGVGATVSEFANVDLTAVTTNVSPNTDDNNDLGSASKRWQDLYLSGGAYLGGTTSANLLSDYEEGTWSVSSIIPAGHSGTLTPGDGQYIKVGDMVFVTIQLAASSFTSPAGTTTCIRGLPFTALTSGTGMPTEYAGINIARSTQRDLFSVEVCSDILWLHPTDQFGRLYDQLNISVVYRTS